MSATPPQPLEGTQGSTPFEILWEKHRQKVNAVVWLLIAGFAVYYGLRYYKQSVIDREWSVAAGSLLLEPGYAFSGSDLQSVDPVDVALLRTLEAAPIAELEKSKLTANPTLKPYVLWLLANRYATGKDKDFAKAEAACKELKDGFGKHVLCAETSYPVQVRQPEDAAKDDKKKKKETVEEEKLKPQVKGSMVGLLEAEIARMKQFELPAQLKAPVIPADAPKYKIKLSGNREITIALLTAQAPKHAEAFEKLVGEKHWDGLHVDRIERPTKQTRLYSSTQFHFGYESTKSDTAADWDTTKPADEKDLVDEQTGLSAFPGAICARPGTGGKSEIGRIWIAADDASRLDGTRQVFGYVTDGLDVVKGICDGQFAQLDDEKRGGGRPQEMITIESITKV
jgi:cyclophilin family peptidyl-prolyl cis-trans isomerase